MSNLNERTLTFYKNADIDKRKDEGQYMTPYNIVIESLKDITFNSNHKVLEPSFGTGQFVDKLIDKKYKNIYAVEKDKELFELSKTAYKNLKTTCFNLINADFLTHNFNTKFDLIIGNPPYFEMECSEQEKKLFKDVICGRPNIYSLFIKKSIDLLENNGILCFVIPTSLLSSKYFEKTREYIIKYCNIQKILKLSNDLFDSALQKTMIFQIIKRSDNQKFDKKYTVNIGDTFIFSPDYIEVNDFLKDKTFIKDLNCHVKTGSIVWNQFRDKFKDKFINDSKSNNFDNIPLIYPRNLKNGKIVLNKDEKKPQYIKHDIHIQPISGPVIVINRIIGLDNLSLHPILIEKGKYFFENHINYITGSLDNLIKIKNTLENENTIKFIKKIIGNTQLSKTELETMIPIDINDDNESYISEDDLLNEDDFNEIFNN